MRALTERERCATAESIAIDWDFSKDTQGWEPWTQLAAFEIRNGVLSAQAEGNDPYMGSPLVDLSALWIGNVEIVMRVLANQPTLQGEVYWLASGQMDFSPDLKETFQVQADGEYYTYRVDIAQSGKLRMGDRISRLRLDPVDGKANLVTYYNASRIGFVNNDWYYIEQVVRYNLPDYLALYFDPRLQSGWYRPGFGLLYLIVYALFGTSTAAHHWAHIVLHVANALFLFALIRRFTRAWRVALIAPLVYVGLPVYSKAVYWISVPDPLSVFISFIAVWCWGAYVETNRARYYAAAFVAFAAALVSKETSIIVPAILFLMDRLLYRRSLTRRVLIWRYLPFALIVLPYLAIEFSIQKSGMYVSVAGYGVGWHMLTNLIDGLAWSVFPVELPAPFNYLWLVLIALIVGWWIAAKKDWRVAFLVGVAIVPLLPVVGFTSFWFERRYMYITTMATAILLAGILDRVWGAFNPRALYSMLIAGAIVLVAVANFGGVNDQIASWGEIARQRRVPFRDIVRAHPTFPENTYFYFLDSPIVPLYDLSVMFLLQYGKGVVVEGVDGNQIARFGGFPNAYVYYFDSDGRPIGVTVDRAVQVFPVMPLQRKGGFRL